MSLIIFLVVGLIAGVVWPLTSWGASRTCW